MYVPGYLSHAGRRAAWQALSQFSHYAPLPSSGALLLWNPLTSGNQESFQPSAESLLIPGDSTLYNESLCWTEGSRAASVNVEKELSTVWSSASHAAE